MVEQDPMLEELCKPLCCKLCNVTLNSAQQAQAHYQVRREQQEAQLLGLLHLQLVETFLCQHEHCQQRCCGSTEGSVG